MTRSAACSGASITSVAVARAFRSALRQPAAQACRRKPDRETLDRAKRHDRYGHQRSRGIMRRIRRLSAAKNC
jgi:hypothetical protein